MKQATPLLNKTSRESFEDTAADEFETLLRLGFPVDQADTTADVPSPTAPGRQGWRSKLRAHGRKFTRVFVTDDRGAVTAEYALVIMAAVAFAGLLIVIMRSDEVRAMLLQLVQNALGSAG
ncbi:MAG: DUF4244 domain-containing protein [Leucobacter sp.]